MFNLKTIVDDAHNLEVHVVEDLEGREKELVAELKAAIENVVKKIGGYVSVTGNGSFNPVEGRHGDKIHLDINTMPKPDAPAPSGLTPPEASTSTPQASDGSFSPPPAGIPQPADPTPVVDPVTESLPPIPADSAETPPQQEPGVTPSASESPVSDTTGTEQPTSDPTPGLPQGVSSVPAETASGEPIPSPTVPLSPVE